MSKVIEYVIEFKKEWVLSHKDDEVLPCAMYKRALLEKYDGDIELALQGVYTLAFKIKGDAALTVTDFLVGFTREKYNDSMENALSVRHGESVIDDKPVLRSRFIFENATDAYPQSSGTGTMSAPSEAEKRVSPISGVWKMLDDMPGCEEFKKIIKEAEIIAPVLSSKNSKDVFLNQHYLFSINDGYGLSAYIDVLNKVIGALNIANVTSAGRIYYLKPNEKGEGMEIFNDVLSSVSRVSSGTLSIFCIDLCNYMKDTNTTRFKEFFKKLHEERQDKIYIFRVPYVDKEVLERVTVSLNDILYTRSVSFPPLTIQELRHVATAALSEKKITMSEEAWPIFDERISEEKRDGSFYGLDTVVKIVNEMIYKKFLYDAQNGIASDVIIPDEIKDIVSEDEVDDKSGFEMLNELIGTTYIKEKIMEIISQIDLARAEDEMGSPCIHMRFVGNPGTGKTTVARIIGRILKEKGVLRLGNFYEYSGRDLVGRFIGETAPKVTGMCRDAYGSVMFIDEAYSLYVESSGKDFGKEALDTLIAEMENHRDDFVVIMAGYTDEMETLMKGNAGLKSRIPYTIEFPNFTREQLYEIFVKMVGKKIPCEDDVKYAVKDYINTLTDDYISSKEFSNARFIRNLFERICAKAALRCQMAGERSIKLTKDDFDRAIQDSEFDLHEKKKTKRIGFTI